MYIGRRGKTYYVARMPGTGFLHAEDCPAANSGDDIQSGVGHYAPGAVTAQATGDYVLHHTPRSAPFQGGDVVSIEGLLDFIIELSDLNVWEGNPVAFRAWKEAREMLVSGAQRIRLSDQSALFDHLLIPYPFEQSKADEQQDKFYQFLAAEHQFRYVLSPVKRILKSRYGWGIFMKHLASLSFWLSERTADEWGKHRAIDLATAPENLMCLALVKSTGKDKRSFTVLDMALRRLDGRMMPSAGPIADDVTASFAKSGRRFSKPLRFDAPLSAPIADYMLDNEGEPRPVLLLAPEDHQEAVSARQALATRFSHAKIAAAIFNGREWRNLPSGLSSRGDQS